MSMSATMVRFRNLTRLMIDIFVRLLTIVVIVGLGLYWGRLFEALLMLVAILQFELGYR